MLATTVETYSRFLSHSRRVAVALSRAGERARFKVNIWALGMGGGSILPSVYTTPYYRLTLLSPFFRLKDSILLQVSNYG